MAASTPPKANPCRYQGQKGHYEVWYVTGHAPDGSLGWWLRTTLEHPLEGAPYGAQWFTVLDQASGERAGWCKRFPITAFAASENPFEASLEQGQDVVRLTDGRYGGQITAGETPLVWDLSWQPEEQAHYHFPLWLYESRLIGTKVLSPTLDGRASGFLQWGDRRVSVQEGPMCQTHLWGTKHAEQWAWGHCNAFAGAPGVVLETVSASVKKGNFTLPVLTTLRFRCPEGEVVLKELWQAPQAQTTFRPGYYAIELTKGPYRLMVKFSAPHDGLILAEYEDPDGEKSFCHFAGLGDCWVSLEKRNGLAGFQPLAQYHARHTASFEAGARLPLASLPQLQVSGFGAHS